MAIVTCDDCGGKVSDRAASCPHCGCPVSTGSSARYDGPLSRCGACGKQVSVTAGQCPHCGCEFCEVEGCTQPRASAPPIAIPGGGSLGSLVREGRRSLAIGRESKRCREHQTATRCGKCGSLLLGGWLDKLEGQKIVYCCHCDTHLCSIDGCYAPAVTRSVFRGNRCQAHSGK